MRIHEPWTELELQALRANRAKGMSWDEIAARLPGRTARACEEMAGRKLGETRAPRSSRAGRFVKPKPDERAVPERRCLSCRREFCPESRGNFVCHACKTGETWRLGAALPG